MKNIFKSLMLVAVAAMGFACQETNEDFAPERANEVVMTITADVDETRTYIDEVNKIVKWSEGDQLKVIENSAVYRTTQAATIAADGKAQFAVSFPANTSASEFTYDAIFPASAVVEDNAEKVSVEKIKVIVKDQQKPTATSFDPQADVLVAKQVVVDAQPTKLNMQFKRLVAMGKMTLKNLPADAKISQVVFTAGAKDVLAGRNYVNAATGKVSEYGYFGDTNIVTLNYDEAISTRDIYFVCNPFEMAAGETFKVKAVCGDKSYTREVTIPEERRSLVFTEGNLGTFSVDMTNATVETVSAFAEGKYVVIAKSSDKYYAMKGVKGSGNFMSHVEVAYDGAAATFTTDDKTLVWDIAAVDGGYTFQNSEGKYLYWSSGNYSYLGDASKAQVMTITPIDGASQYKVAVKDTPERILSYNESSPRFAFYGNTEQKYELYLVPVVADTTPRFTVDPMEFEFDAAGGDITFTTTSNEYLKTAISVTDDADWLTISGSGNTFKATATENKESAERLANITFSAEGAESVVVTVTQNAAGSITDTLNRATTGITGTTYATWSGKTGESGAVYAGQSAGGNDAIQLRATNPSGIITTTSGGKARKIVVTWQSSTAAGRILDIYGKNTAYSAAADLYSTSSSTQGTKLGSIKCGTSTELTINDDYAYIGLRSSSGAMYITSIEITWETGGESETPAVPEKLATPTNLKHSNITENSFTLTWDAVANASGYKVTCGNEEKDVTDDPTVEFTGLTANTKYEVSVVAVGDNYTNSDAATISVTTLAEQTGGGETPSEQVATLSFANKAQRTSFSSTKQVWAQNGITFTNDKASSSTPVADYAKPARLYANSSVTVEAPGNITKIVFDCNSGSYATALKNSIGSNVSVSSDKVTVTLDGKSSTFTIAKLTAQVRIDAITVTYQK